MWRTPTHVSYPPTQGLDRGKLGQSSSSEQTQLKIARRSSMRVKRAALLNWRRCFSASAPPHYYFMSATGSPWAIYEPSTYSTPTPEAAGSPRLTTISAQAQSRSYSEQQQSDVAGEGGIERRSKQKPLLHELIVLIDGKAATFHRFLPRRMVENVAHVHIPVPWTKSR